MGLGWYCRLVSVLYLFECTWCAYIGEIQWNISNPIFKYNDYDGQGVLLKVCLMDHFVFSCPYWADPETNPVIFQYLVVHAVPEYEFTNCRIDPRYNTNKVGLVCLSPDRKTDQHTVMFDDGKSVGTVQHYISTSSGNKDGWDNELGGVCLKENMKLRVEILDQDCDRNEVNGYNRKILSLQGLPDNHPYLADAPSQAGQRDDEKPAAGEQDYSSSKSNKHPTCVAVYAIVTLLIITMFKAW